MLTALLPLAATLGIAQEDPPPDEPEVVDLPIDVGLPPEPLCPDAAWPGEAWPDRAAEVRRGHAAAVAALDQYLFDPSVDLAGKERAGIRTDGVVLVHQGQIVYERYRAPWSAEHAHASWSVTKSVLSALVGVAVKREALRLDDSVCAHLPGVPEPTCAITVQDLLESASGLAWRETYEDQSPTASSVLAMLYGAGATDMAAFVAEQPRVREPGAAWQYSSGDSVLLSAVVGAALGPALGERFPWAALFDELGMASATFEQDAAGTYVGSSYLHATPRDLARFGFLYLHGGCWNGVPLLPEDWVGFSTEIPPPLRASALGLEDLVHARLWWVNQPLPEHGISERWCPSAPERTFAALGHWGQSITVIPEADLVVVRTADDRDESYDHDRTLALAQALIQELR